MLSLCRTFDDKNGKHSAVQPRIWSGNQTITWYQEIPPGKLITALSVRLVRNIHSLEIWSYASRRIVDNPGASMFKPLNGSGRSCQCFKRVRLADAVHIKISASPFQKPTSPNGKNYTSTARWSNLEPSLKPSNRQLSKSAIQRPVSHSVKNARASKSRTRRRSSSMSAPKGLHRAIVAFGGNIGDTVAHIENAIHSLRENGIRIIKLSKLYRTQPMYVEDQAPFLNGVALIETTLKPIELLDLLQKTENEQGRVRKIAKGPRTLDLDIILYDNEQINHERLQVPHPLMMEREFVLRPLAE